jgi:hypothetical protein
MFSPGPVATKGAGKRGMSVSSPTVSSKVSSEHLQHLQFRAIATCKPDTTVSSRVEVEHSQHLQIPRSVTFQLLHIASGHNEAFPVQFDGTRACSLAKGVFKGTFSNTKSNFGEIDV